MRVLKSILQTWKGTARVLSVNFKKSLGTDTFSRDIETNII